MATLGLCGGASLLLLGVWERLALTAQLNLGLSANQR
jgi:hypothetical protein